MQRLIDILWLGGIVALFLFILTACSSVEPEVNEEFTGRWNCRAILLGVIGRDQAVSLDITFNLCQIDDKKVEGNVEVKDFTNGVIWNGRVNGVIEPQRGVESVQNILSDIIPMTNNQGDFGTLNISLTPIVENGHNKLFGNVVFSMYGEADGIKFMNDNITLEKINEHDQGGG